MFRSLSVDYLFVVVVSLRLLSFLNFRATFAASTPVARAMLLLLAPAWNVVTAMSSNTSSSWFINWLSSHRDSRFWSVYAPEHLFISEDSSLIQDCMVFRVTVNHSSTFSLRV